jgi:DNA processing protein
LISNKEPQSYTPGELSRKVLTTRSVQRHTTDPQLPENAALSAGTVVVEAGRRSGSRNTATTAESLGRVVMAVPGPITSAMSVGCHELLRENQASLVTSVAEVIESIGRFGDDLVERLPVARRSTDGLDEPALRVHEALDPRVERGVPEIAVGSGVPLDKVRAVLPMLELRGLAAQTDGGWRRHTPQGDPRARVDS